MDDSNLFEAPNFVNFEEAGSINGAMMRFQAKHPVLETIAERLGKFSSLFSNYFWHSVDFFQKLESPCFPIMFL